MPTDKKKDEEEVVNLQGVLKKMQVQILFLQNLLLKASILQNSYPYLTFYLWDY